MILIIIAAISTVAFEIYYRRKKKNIALAEKLFIKIISERVDTLNDHLPDNVQRLKYLLPAIKKIDLTIRDPFWEYIKSRLIRKFLKKEIYYSLHSFKWGKTHFALQAISMFPEIAYEDDVLKFLKYKKDIVRFSAAGCAVKFGTKKSIEALIKALAEEPLKTQFPFRDPLLYSNTNTFHIIKNYYLRTKDTTRKIACLKILSMKMGFLTIEEIKENLNSDHLELRWWSIRAIENNTSNEGLEILYSLLEDPNFAIRSLVIFSLGSLKDLNCVDKIAKLLHDSHHWVRFIAAVTLKYLGPKGESILKNDELQQSPEIKETCEYLFAIPDVSFDKGLEKFFPINQDPLTIIEALL